LEIYQKKKKRINPNVPFLSFGECYYKTFPHIRLQGEDLLSDPCHFSLGRYLGYVSVRAEHAYSLPRLNMGVELSGTGSIRRQEVAAFLPLSLTSALTSNFVNYLPHLGVPPAPCASWEGPAVSGMEKVHIV